MGAGLGLGDPQMDSLNGEGSEFHGLGLSSVAHLTEFCPNRALLTSITSRTTPGNSYNLSTTTRHSSPRYIKANFPPRPTRAIPPSQFSRPPICTPHNNSSPSISIRHQTNWTPDCSEINCASERWTRGERALGGDIRLVMGVAWRGLRGGLSRGRVMVLVL